MFAKLKKKIQDENYTVSSTESLQNSSAAVEKIQSSSNQPSVHSAGTDSISTSYHHRKVSRNSTSSNDDNANLNSNQDRQETMKPDVSSIQTISSETKLNAGCSEKDLAELLAKRNDQVQIMENKLTELSGMLVDKNKTIEKLETALEKQQDVLCQRVQELNEQYHNSRAKMAESIAMAVRNKEEEMRAEITALQKKFLNGQVESSESDRYAVVIAREEQRRVGLEKKVSELSAQVSSLEKQLKESKEKFAQMALQTNQDDLLEKQIESEKALSVLEDEISTLKNDLFHRDSEKRLLTKDLNTKSKELADATEKIALLQRDSESKDLTIQKLQQTTNELQQRLEESKNDTDTYQKNVRLLKTESDSIKQDLESSKVEFELRLQEKDDLIKTLQQRADEHETTFNEFKLQLEDLESKRLFDRNNIEMEATSKLQDLLNSAETQIQDKNKIIRKQEQRIADLKKTLQRELKTPGSTEAQQHVKSLCSNPNLSSSRDSLLNNIPSDQNDFASSGDDSSTAATLAVSSETHHNSSRSKHQMPYPMSSSSPRGNNYSHNNFNRSSNVIMDDKFSELNFKYLRHIVLKFILSREHEAMQLIKAISMLLNFTQEEQMLIKETLEWKMSWFGARPQLPAQGQSAKVIPSPF